MAKNIFSTETMRIARRAVLGFACVMIFCAPSEAAKPVRRAAGTQASSSKASKKDAIAAIPFGRLTQREQDAVKSVISKVSIYRKMPTKVIECDPEFFSYLAKKPQIIANTWEVLGLSKLRITEIDKKNFLANDGNGTTGRMRILSSEQASPGTNKILVYAEGKYDGKPFLKPVKARCVCLFQCVSKKETNGRNYVTARIDTFIVIDQFGLDLIAKTLHPILGKTGDHNFVETMNFASNFSNAAERNPTGVEKLCRKLSRVSLDDRQELIQIAFKMQSKRLAWEETHLKGNQQTRQASHMGTSSQDRSRQDVLLQRGQPIPINNTARRPITIRSNSPNGRRR